MTQDPPDQQLFYQRLSYQHAPTVADENLRARGQVSAVFLHCEETGQTPSIACSHRLGIPLICPPPPLSRLRHWSARGKSRDLPYPSDCSILASTLTTMVENTLLLHLYSPGAAALLQEQGRQGGSERHISPAKRVSSSHVTQEACSYMLHLLSLY